MYKFLRFSYFLIIFYSTVFLNNESFSQGQRGKLVGTIFDFSTSEPIIGASVVIEGTTLGAVADTKGRFLILNVPPGFYNITASSLGYAKYTIKNVEIIVDRTTELSFKLKDASIQLEQVVVVAERPKIIKDQTSTSTTLDETQIKSAPIEGIRGMLDLTAGLQKTATGLFQVRGSGGYELNFQINGVEQMNSAQTSPGSFGTDKANNSWKYDVNPIGVQQLQLITGGFSSEYGNSQAGVVKVVLKEGSPKFNGEFRVEYRPPGQYHWGEFLYSKNNYEWKKWGDINVWKNKTKTSNGKWDENFLSLINVLGNNRWDWLLDRIKRGQASQSDSALFNSIVDREVTWAYDLWVKDHTPSDDNPLGVYDYRKYAYTRYMFGFGGPLGKDPNLLRFYFSGEYKRVPTRLPTAEKVQVYQNYILNFTYQPLSSHKIKGMFSFQQYRGGIWTGSEDIRWSGIAFVPDGVSTKYYVLIDPVRTEQTIAQSFNWVYTMNSTSFLEATLTHQQEKYVLPYLYLPGYSQERDRVDSAYDKTGSLLRAGTWWEVDYYRSPDALSTNYYQDTRTNHWSISIDYTDQIISTNLIKTGLRFYYWDMFNNGVNSSFKPNSYIAMTGYAEYYKAYPYNLALYIQDKMEYSGMIANIGVRAEAFNFQYNYPADIYNIFYPGRSGPALGSPITTSSKTQFIILPRLGISFPIGENTAFRIQYGHFASMPTFSQALSRRTASGWAGYGNPNLEPKKTIQYEFGLQQMLDEEHRFDAALYYNDRVTQVGLLRVASLTGSTLNSPEGFNLNNDPLYRYTTFANNTFGATLGLELVLEKVNFRNWAYRLSYNLSQTTEGNYGPQVQYPGDSRSYYPRNYTGEFISYNDRTHNFRGLVQYRINEGEGFSLFGVNILENSVFSLTYSAQSGSPFTYVTAWTTKDVRVNRRYPVESTFDFNFIKNLTWDSYKIIIGLRIMNLFDNKWITPMNDDTQNNIDLRNWVEYGYTMADLGNDNPNSPRRAYVISPYKTYRNMPRQIFFTVGFGF